LSDDLSNVFLETKHISRWQHLLLQHIIMLRIQ